jgi:hypothetical protein
MWLVEQDVPGARSVALFGRGGASAAVLFVAATQPEWLGAVIAGDQLSDVEPTVPARIIAPTLLLACQSQPRDVERGERTRAALLCPNDLVLVPDAHENSGQNSHCALDAAHWVTGWMARHVGTLKRQDTPSESPRRSALARAVAGDVASIRKANHRAARSRARRNMARRAGVI